MRNRDEKEIIDEEPVDRGREEEGCGHGITRIYVVYYGGVEKCLTGFIPKMLPPDNQITNFRTYLLNIDCIFRLVFHSQLFS